MSTLERVAAGRLRRTRLDDLAKRGPVRRVLGNRLAEVKGLASPVVDDELQVVRGDAAGDGVAALLDLRWVGWERSSGKRRSDRRRKTRTASIAAAVVACSSTI